MSPMGKCGHGYMLHGHMSHGHMSPNRIPIYIGKSGDLVGCHRCLTYSQTTEYRATQLV